MMEIGKKHNITLRGKGDKILVFGHGLACDQRIWSRILPYFEEDYRMVLFDYVGSGLSDHGAYDLKRYKTLQGHGEDLKLLIETLDLWDITFVGHSVSAMIGLLAAVDLPERFKSLVMIGPSPRYLNDGDYFGGFEEEEIHGLLRMMEMNFTGWATAHAGVFLNQPNLPAEEEHLRGVFLREDPRLMRQFAEATFFSDHRKDLSRCPVPALILQCAEDSVVPREVGEYLHAHLAGSQLVHLPVTGHYPHLVAPEQTAAVIRQYLKHVELSTGEEKKSWIFD